MVDQRPSSCSGHYASPSEHSPVIGKPFDRVAQDVMAPSQCDEEALALRPDFVWMEYHRKLPESPLDLFAVAIEIDAKQPVCGGLLIRNVVIEQIREVSSDETCSHAGVLANSLVLA